MQPREITPLIRTDSHVISGGRQVLSEHTSNVFNSIKICVRKGISRVRNREIRPAVYLQASILLILVVGLTLLLTNIFMIRSLHNGYAPKQPKSPAYKLVEAVDKNWINLENLYTNELCLLDSFLVLDTTQGIKPVACHSHNDYDRSVPLWEAILNGCISIEADIHPDPSNSSNLIVSHSAKHLDPNHSLTNMYLRPLLHLLNTYNPDYLNLQPGTKRGVYTTSSNTTFVLLIDFKNSSLETFDLLQTHLQPLRAGGYLTTWNATSKSLITGPLTIVTTGKINFTHITSSVSNPHSDIFMDAPLADIPSYNTSNMPYNISNSYYASAALKHALGRSHLNPLKSLSTAEVGKLREQTQIAQELGLKVRYWGTPSWPVTSMIGTWDTLTEDVGVDVLNVDDLELAARWDWEVCKKGIWGICKR